MLFTNREILQRIFLDNRLINTIDELVDGDYMFLTYISESHRINLGEIIKCEKLPEEGILSEGEKEGQSDYQKEYWKFINKEYERIKGTISPPIDADKVVLIIYRKEYSDSEGEHDSVETDHDAGPTSKIEWDMICREFGFGSSCFSYVIPLGFSLLLYNLSREYDNPLLVFCDDSGGELVNLNTLREVSPLYQRDDFFSHMSASGVKEFLLFVRNRPANVLAKSIDDSLFEKAHFYLDKDAKTILE